MKRLICLVVISCLIMSNLYAQDYLANWILDSASYNSITFENASGYLKFISDTEYKASFSDGSNSGSAQAYYSISESIFNTSIDGKPLPLNGAIVVIGPNGYRTFINSSQSAFLNYVGPAIGYGKPTITVSDNVLTLTSSDGKAVVVYAKGISPGFTASPTTGYVPLNVEFTDESTGNITTWEWDFGDGNTSTGQNPSHIYETEGVYTVSLTVTDGNAQSETITKTDHIQADILTAPEADFTGTPLNGEYPLNVQFTDNSNGNYSEWLWDFGDGNTSTEQNPIHTYTMAGTYTVSLTVTGDGGTDTETKTDYISVTVPAITADFEAEITYGKAPLEVSFWDQSTGPVTEWIWDFGDGSTISAQNASFTFNNPGEHTVTLTVKDNIQNDTDTKQISIYVWTENWTSDIEGDLYSIAALDEDETIYLRKTKDSGEELVEAIDKQGNQKWEFVLPEFEYGWQSGISIGPDGTLCFAYSGDLFAISSNGTLKWENWIPPHFADPPAVDNNGNIYYSISDAFDCWIYSVNKEGTENWTLAIENDEIFSSPAIGKGGTVYIGSLALNKLYAINPNGTIEWSFQAGGKITNPAIGIDGTILFISADGYLYAVNRDSTLRWKYQTEWEFDDERSYLIRDIPLMVDLDGNIYYSENGIRALTPDGEEKWKYESDPEKGPCKWLSIGENSLIYGKCGDYLTAIKLDGTLEWSFPMFEDGSKRAIILDAMLYADDGNKKLKSIAFPVAGPMKSTWPCFRSDFQNTSNASDRIVSIKQIHEDEYSQYSVIINVFPNPTNNLLTIEADIPDHYLINITSLNGQQIYSTDMEGISNQIDLSSFQKGVYFITIRSKDYVTTRKIIKL